MRRNLLMVVSLLSPYFVGFEPIASDSSWAEFRVALGRTRSRIDVSRDCSRGVLDVDDVPFNQGGIAFDYHMSALHLGVKGGVMSEHAAKQIYDLAEVRTLDQGVSRPVPGGPVFYVTPTVGFNTTYFGLDAGYSAAFPRLVHGIPAGMLRIGMRDAFHFRFRLADDVPLMSGGPGVYNAGFSFNIREPNQSLWLGIGIVPYDGLMFGSQLELPLSDFWLLTVGASLGLGEGTEYGLSAGTRLRF